MASIDQHDVIMHPGESTSNDARSRLDQAEPKCLRTYTSSLCVIEKSAGAYHYTPEGRKLADFSSGVLVANLGHNPRRWWSRVLELLAIDNVTTATDSAAGDYLEAAPLTAYNATTPVEIQASELLLQSLQNAPGGNRMEQVLWSASGSEAIQKAIWAAFRYRPGADKIIATRGGFHGKKGLAGAITGSEEDKERDPRVRFISFPKQECQDLEARRQPIDLAIYQKELEAIDQEWGDQVCCLVTEPYLGGGGSYHPQSEYLQLLQSYCRERDILFILDEIQSNFGRTGPMYAFTHYGIEPDIVCLGKGLGNGIPVSAAVGRRDVFGKMPFGEGSDTWSANPISSAAVIATLETFERDNVVAQGEALAAIIESGLVRLKETGVIEYVRGEGLVWGIQCRQLAGRDSAQVANDCVQACYLGDDNGMAIHLLGPLAGNVLRVSPPLTMPLDEAQAYLDAMFNIFTRVAKNAS